MVVIYFNSHIDIEGIRIFPQQYGQLSVNNLIQNEILRCKNFQVYQEANAQESYGNNLHNLRVTSN